jgi:ferredoxin
MRWLRHLRDRLQNREQHPGPHRGPIIQLGGLRLCGERKISRHAVRHIPGPVQPLQQPALRRCLPGSPYGHVQDGKRDYHAQRTKRCIGCQSCQDACPYSERRIDRSFHGYSVISFNEDEPQAFYKDETELLPGITSSGLGVSKGGGCDPSAQDQHPASRLQTGSGAWGCRKVHLLRPSTQAGPGARMRGSMPREGKDFRRPPRPASDVSHLLITHEARRMRNNRADFLAPDQRGHLPNVFYINDYMLPERIKEDDDVFKKRRI